MCDQQGLRPACAYAQSDQSLCLSLEYSMTIKLLTEHHLEILNLTRSCTGSFESTLVKMPHCWKSHVMAQFVFSLFYVSARLRVKSNTKIMVSLGFIWSSVQNNWASSREKLSSGFPSKRVSNRSPQLQRLARKLKFYVFQD